MVCPVALEVGWCDAAGPRSRFGCRALLADALAGPLARLSHLAVGGAGGRWPFLSRSG